MAGFALLCGRDVIVVFAGAGKAASRLVAGVAILRRTLEHAPLMAAFTADGGMRARQRKARQAVINLRRTLRERHFTYEQPPCEKDRKLQHQQHEPAR